MNLEEDNLLNLRFKRLQKRNKHAQISTAKPSSFKSSTTKTLVAFRGLAFYLTLIELNPTHWIESINLSKHFMDSKTKDANARVRYSRERTNILKASEFKAIEFLCKIMPSWASPNMMTVIGVFGSAIIAYGLYLAQ